MFSFGVKGGYQGGQAFIEAVELASHLANIGDTQHSRHPPASTTHRRLSDEDRAAAGVGPDLVRVSVGIEDLDDIIWDFDRALAAATKAAE